MDYPQGSCLFGGYSSSIYGEHLRCNTVDVSSISVAVFPVLPALFRLLNLSVIPRSTEEFFNSVVTEAIKGRKGRETVRHVCVYVREHTCVHTFQLVGLLGDVISVIFLLQGDEK